MVYTDFYNELRNFPVFSVTEIEKHFPGFDSRRLVEWQKKGYISKLRNRFYCFTDQEIDESFLYYAANELYHPSYISLESALSYYRFIPEGVFQITSCTTLKTNSFAIPFGTFSYRHLKPSLFFGYTLQEWDDHRYAIAEPEKVLIDYLYLHTEIEGTEDISALRWNAAEIANRISIDTFNNYEAHIGSPALSRRIIILRNYLNAAT